MLIFSFLWLNLRANLLILVSLITLHHGQKTSKKQIRCMQKLNRKWMNSFLKNSIQNSLACFFLSITSVNVTHSFISKVTPKLSKKNSAFIFAQIVGRIPIFKLKMCRINQVLCTVIHKKMQISENFVHLLALD